MENNKKYIMAHIRFPIEILETGEQISHMNRTVIDFDACNELPPEQNIEDIDFTVLLQNILNNEKEENSKMNKWIETTITREVIQKKTQSKNISFRKKGNINHNFSVKNIKCSNSKT